MVLSDMDKGGDLSTVIYGIIHYPLQLSTCRFTHTKSTSTYILKFVA